jgi:hypothetical protein
VEFIWLRRGSARRPLVKKATNHKTRWISRVDGRLLVSQNGFWIMKLAGCCVLLLHFTLNLNKYESDIYGIFYCLGLSPWWHTLNIQMIYYRLCAVKMRGLAPGMTSRRAAPKRGNRTVTPATLLYNIYGESDLNLMTHSLVSRPDLPPQSCQRYTNR